MSHRAPSQPAHLDAVGWAADLSKQLQESGKWLDWRSCQPERAWPETLLTAAQDWTSAHDTRSYVLVASLARLGSRRGGDDNDAALAVVVLLDEGIRRLATRLTDVCELDDVRAAVWEEVRCAEPQLGHRAPRFLLKRAQQRLLRSTLR